MAYKPIPVESVDVSTINRIQANVASEFAVLTNPNGIGVTAIASSKALTKYQVQSGDRYLVVDASGGPITIALPAPGNQAVITIVQSDSSKNAITVSAPKGFTTTTLKAPTTLLNTGTTWVQL